MTKWNFAFVTPTRSALASFTGAFERRRLTPLDSRALRQRVVELTRIWPKLQHATQRINHLFLNIYYRPGWGAHPKPLFHRKKRSKKKSRENQLHLGFLKLFGCKFNLNELKQQLALTTLTAEQLNYEVISG